MAKKDVCKCTYDMGKSRILDILNRSRIVEIRLLHFVTVEADSTLNCHILIQILIDFVSFCLAACCLSCFRNNSR